LVLHAARLNARGDRGAQRRRSTTAAAAAGS